MSASVVKSNEMSNELECKQDEISPTLINKQQSTDLVNGYIKNIKLNVKDDIIIPNVLIDLCLKFFYINIQDLIDSKSYNELYQIASDLYDSGYYTKAILIVQYLMIQKAGIDDHKDALILHIYALILDEYKDYKQSAIHYQRAISLDPRNNCIFANYALSLQEQQKFIESESEFLKALELVDDVYDRHNLAKLYEETKQYDKAEEQYKIICKNGETPNPTSVQYYADYLKRIEKYSEAAIQYKLVIDLLQEMEKNQDNNDKDKGICNQKKLMYLRMGICYKRLNQFVNAECALKRCLEIDKNYILAHDHYAHWFYCKKRYDESLAYYKKIINMNPTDCDWYYWVALNLRELQRYNESVKYYKICLSMNPVSKNVNGSYSHCLYLMDKLDEALYYMDIAKTLDSDNEWTHYYNALLMRKLKKYKEADDAFKQCLKMNEKNHRCNYQYGLFLIEIKNELKEALKYLEMAKNEEKDNQKYNDKYSEISKMAL